MEEAGFAMAAGIKFQYMHHRGIVIFLTTLEDEKDDRLNCVTNAAYLCQAAQFIGAALSLAEIRRKSLAERYKLKEKCYKMHECTEYHSSPLVLVEEGEGGKAPEKKNVDRSHTSIASKIKQSSYSCIPPRAIAWSRKLKGGSMQIPPSLSWKQTMWTIFGSFIGLLVLVLSLLNEYYCLLSDDDYYLLIGPFGAMCTLMYGLSEAPASQPRNTVMRQVVAGAVSLTFTNIPEDVLPVWLCDGVCFGLSSTHSGW